MNEPLSLGAVTPGKFARIREIFELALEQAPDLRAAFVENASGGDSLVVAEVRRMLAAHEERNPLLDGAGGAGLRPGEVFAGHFEILEHIGRGGMGEVYRGRDSTLNRDVAIKVLPDSFAGDTSRLTRFQREAQLLASVNHPNIAAIYGIADAGGVRALVLELVDGPTLSDRMERGPVPVEEAAPIARQIAEALEAAHDQGVIHRDLKPANIKLRPDGVVKVLDFGLAKALRPPETAPAHSFDTPTATKALMTGTGVILGTPAYMSPEQAKGNAVDRRADIWAFGVVLYEMLSGRRAFDGASAPEILASLLRDEIDWSALPSSTPPALRTLLSRCLDRDPKRRLRDIGEARIVLSDPAALAASEQAAVSVAAAIKPIWRTALSTALAVAVTGVVAGTAAWRLKPSPKSPVARFSFTLPEGQELSAAIGGRVLSVSPDGTQIVYPEVRTERLYLRSISRLEVRPVAGSEGYSRITDPTFSPDGAWIAFYALADRSIKKIPTAGGAAVTICQAGSPLGLSWGPHGIVFGQEKAILRVSPNGGRPAPLVPLNEDELASAPEILPDGKHVLFTLAARNGINKWDKASVVAQSLSTGKRKTLIQGGSDARYVQSGHIVYVFGGRLTAVAFDVKRLEVKSSPAPIVDGVRRADLTGTAQYSVSSTGSLVYTYAAGSFREQELALISRRGEVEKLNLPPAAYLWPRASRDGKQIAFVTDDGKEAIVWVYDLSGKTEKTRLTFGSNNRFPVWSPDKHVTFQSDREGDLALFWQPAGGTGRAERLTTPEKGTSHVPESWSPDGRVLLYTVTKGPDTVNGPRDISLWMLSMKDRSVGPFGSVRSSVPIGAVFRPDGRWVAYATGRTSRTSLFVQPFPPTGAMHELSTNDIDSPHDPVWSPDGKELFYNPRPRGFEAVTVNTAETFTFGRPVPLPRPFQLSPPESRRMYDIMPDSRFLGRIWPGYGTPSQVNVVLNWFDELAIKAPADK